MASITVPPSTLTTVTFTNADSLGNVTYAVSSVMDWSSIDPLDVILQVNITPGTVSGNKMARLFLKTSVDGTDYSTGPESGTTVTDEPCLIPLPSLQLPSNSTLQRRHVSVIAALGYVPPYAKLVVFNDSGAAFASSGNALKYATVLGASA